MTIIRRIALIVMLALAGMTGALVVSSDALADCSKKHSV